MKRSNKRKTQQKKRKSNASQNPQVQAKKPMSRRQALRKMGIYAGGAVAVAAGGAWFISDFRGKLAEGDLSQIGQGRPTIVQIHDPSCPLCLQLQKQARIALRNSDEDYQYLVANIRTESGAAFQSRMGQPHVTLVLLDGDGAFLHAINGVTPAEELQAQFQQYLR